MLDFSKAFDMVNHELLIAKLHYYGLGSEAINLMQSYIENRSQKVKINNEMSRPRDLAIGVPQGRILSPILFIVYTADLPEVISLGKVHMYADDTQFYISNNRESTTTIIAAANTQLTNLTNCVTENRLQINPNKSKSICFGHCTLRRYWKETMECIMLMGEKIEEVEVVQDLRLHIDASLSFSQQVAYMNRNAYRKLKYLHQYKYILPADLKLQLAEVFVLSTYNYCDTVYGPHLTRNLVQKIQKIQNPCIRFAYNIPRREHISPILLLHNVLNMENRRTLHLLVQIHRVINDTDQPQYLKDCIQFRNETHDVNTRGRDTINIPKFKTTQYKNSFSYLAGSLFNKIPEEVQKLSTISFKKKMRHHLMLLQREGNPF